jgi:hypothetical protein
VRKYPCDLKCIVCGGAFKDPRSYERHEADCSPKKYTITELQELTSNTTVNNNINSFNTNVVNNNTHIGDNNLNLVLNLKIDDPDKRIMLLSGITPHGVECSSFFYNHGITIDREIIRYLESHDKKTEANHQELEVLVMKMITIFYSNQKFPQHINILDDEPSANHNKVYSGVAFVKDVMPKNKRNQKILQVIVSFLEEYKGKDINPFARKFVERILIPHIKEAYFNNGYQNSLQYVWGNNTKMIKKLDISKVPPYRSNTYNHLIAMKEQVEEYVRTNQEFVEEADDALLKECVMYIHERQLLDNPVTRLGLTNEASPPEVDTPVSEGVSSEPIIEEPDDDDNTPEVLTEPAEPTEEEIRLEEKRLAMIEAVRVSSGLSQNYRKL